MIKKLIVSVLMVIACVAAIVLMNMGRDSAPVAPAKSSAMEAPDFQFKALDGDKEYTLSKWRGDYVLINFWASWCPPCRAEFPEILALAAEFPKNLKIVAISGDDKQGDAAHYVSKLQMLYQAELAKDNVVFVWDANKRLSLDTFSVLSYPESILVNPEGEMVFKVVGQLIPQDLNFIRGTLRGESPPKPKF